MGTAAKAVGAVLVIAGVVALLAGLGAAAYGFYDSDRHRSDLVRDGDRDERNQAFLAWGAAAAGAGLVLFLAGLITMMVAQPRRETEKAMRTAAASPTARTAMTPRKAVAAGALAVGLAVGVLALLLLSDWTGQGPLFRGSGGPESEVVYDQMRNGTLQGGTVTPGLPVVDLGGNEGTFTPAAGSQVCTLTLDWEPAGQGGAARLELRVTAGGAAVARSEGGPGFNVTLSGASLAGTEHGFEVLPVDPGLYQQPFSLRVVCRT